jgi:hypothetical protein
LTPVQYQNLDIKERVDSERAAAQAAADAADDAADDSRVVWSN